MDQNRQTAAARRSGFLLASVAVFSCLLFAGYWYWVRSLNVVPEQLAAISADIQRGDFLSARHGLESLYERSPDRPDVIRYLVDVCLVLDDLDAAVEWAGRFPPSATAPLVEANLELVSRCMQHARARELSACAQRVLRADPGNERALRAVLMLEVLLVDRRGARLAVAELDQLGYATPMDLLTFYPTDEIQWEGIETVTWLRNCLANDPDDVEVRVALARVLHAGGRDREARRVLRDAPAGSDRWQLRLVEALIALDNGDAEAAGDLIQALPQEAEQSVLVWRIRGRLSRDAGDAINAIAAYENALQLDISDLPSRTQLLALQSGRLPPSRRAVLEREVALWERFFQIRGDALDAGSLSTTQLEELGGLFADLGLHREAAICGRRADASPAGRVAAAQSLTLPGVFQFKDWRAPVSGHVVDNGRPTDSDSRAETAPDLYHNVATDAGLHFEHVDGGGSDLLLIKSLGSGVGVLDYDLDQWPDLACVQGRPLDGTAVAVSGDRLFRNLSGRQYVDVTAMSRFAGVAYGHGCAVCDFNNDGFADILLTGFGRNTLLQNAGDGTFHDVTGSAGLVDDDWSTTAAWTDIDRDGDVDLYVGNYCAASIEDLRACEHTRGPSCRPIEFPPAADRIWENLGDGTFRDLTATVCPGVEWGRALGVVVEDFDDDGFPEIFVANDMSRNLYLTRGHDPRASSPLRLVDAALLVGTAVSGDGVSEACMGIAVGDIDNDAGFDLFVTNFEKETNTLYKRAVSGSFVDRTEEYDLAASSREMLAWSTQFVDLNHDEWIDLLVANSHLHGGPMPMQAYLNKAGRRFELLGNGLNPELDRTRMARSFAFLDWNGDGAQDIVLTSKAGLLELLERTDMAPFIDLTLIGTDSPRDATGARVVIQTPAMTLHRRYNAGAGYLASNQNVLHVDVPRTAAGDGHSVTVLVRWPSGNQDTYSLLTLWKCEVLVEGSGRTSLPPRSSRVPDTNK